MKTLRSHWLIGSCVAFLMLVASDTLAGTGADACNLIATGNCLSATTPATCEAECVAPNFVAECDGECSGQSASESCTGTCAGSCMENCTVDPGSFSCTAACVSDCNSSCTTACSGQDTGCASDCTADCSNRCGIQCIAVPPAADCTSKCQQSCNASCQVQANLDCHTNCTANVAGSECSLDCMSTAGAVFCGSQYIDVQTAQANCLTYLQSQGIGAAVTPDAGTEPATPPASKGCSVSSSFGAGDRSGAFGVAGLIVGVGLALSRRRRRIASPS